MFTAGSQRRDREEARAGPDVMHGRMRNPASALICAPNEIRSPTMFMSRKKPEMPTSATALKGRAAPIPTASQHFVNGRPLEGPWPQGLETAVFGMGCFWGAERKFWELDDGIYTTAVGYAGGLTPNPTYREVCSGLTGHNEVVLVVFDPKEDFL